jgi:hypothetical protein
MSQDSFISVKLINAFSKDLNRSQLVEYYMAIDPVVPFF